MEASRTIAARCSCVQGKGVMEAGRRSLRPAALGPSRDSGIERHRRHCLPLLQRLRSIGSKYKSPPGSAVIMTRRSTSPASIPRAIAAHLRVSNGQRTTSVRIVASGRRIENHRMVQSNGARTGRPSALLSRGNRYPEAVSDAGHSKMWKSHGGSSDQLKFE